MSKLKPSKYIFIYKDAGADGQGLHHLFKSFYEAMNSQAHLLRFISAEEIKEGSWKSEAALFVMPGGRDLFYLESLGIKGMQEICSYVKEGGKYLGICGGAYFASLMVEFEKGSAHQICGERYLRFFPGIAKGPAYGPNEYENGTRKGARAALVSYYGESGCYTYYNGGCLFDLARQFSEVEILGTYTDLPSNPAAVIRCSFGKGSALLSGVHFEFSLRHLQPLEEGKEALYLKETFSLLKKDEDKRVLLFHKLLYPDILFS